MKELPVGTTDFGVFKKLNYYYADKTNYLYNIIAKEGRYFLSRPRRFGKTLLLNTMEHILEGHRDLFDGLWIAGSDYDWRPRPVIRLVMTGLNPITPEALDANLMSYLEIKAAEMDLKFKGSTPSLALHWLILQLQRQFGQKVAVLIDEYDDPITCHIDEPPLADEIRKRLSQFYVVLKNVDDKLDLVFITGVSRFAKTKLLSTINNLSDLTFDPAFADVCGLTRQEIEGVLDEFQERVFASPNVKKILPSGADRGKLRKLILDWYDGYSWDGETRVLNPWSVFFFLLKTKVDNYWYESGSPTFLPQWLKTHCPNLDLSKKFKPITEGSLQIEKIDKITPAALMFQTGYLTVARAEWVALQAGPDEPLTLQYHLDYPNLEVKASLVPLLFSIEKPQNPLLAYTLALRAVRHLLSLDAPGFEKAFGGFLAQYDYDLHAPDERYYHSLLKSALNMAEQPSEHQRHTEKGRLDVHVTNDRGDDYIIEVKYLAGEETEDEADDEMPGRIDERSGGAGRDPDVSGGGKERPTPDEIKRAKLRRRMAVRAKRALAQIRNKYLKAFLGGDNKVHMIALVVADRSEVLVEIETAEGRPVRDRP